MHTPLHINIDRIINIFSYSKKNYSKLFLHTKYFEIGFLTGSRAYGHPGTQAHEESTGIRAHGHTGTPGIHGHTGTRAHGQSTGTRAPGQDR